MTPTFQYDTTIVDSDDGSGIADAINATDIPNIRRSQLQTFAFNGGHVSSEEGSDGITRTKITLPDALDQTSYATYGQRGVGDGIVWMIEPTGATLAHPIEEEKKLALYRVLNVGEKDDNKFSVTALEHNPDKFDRVDGIVGFDDSPTVNITAPPVGCILQSLHITENSVEINWNIIPGDLVGVYSYHVYVKFGSPWAATDFVETDPTTTVVLDSVPDSRYFYQSISSSSETGKYFPTQNGNYYFRFYTANRLGLASLSSVPGSWINPANGATYSYVIIQGINPLHDIRIKSLTLTTTETLSTEEIEAGTTYSRVHDLAEPRFSWQMDIAGQSPSTIFDYRITIREPSNSNNPSLVIYGTDTLTARSSSQLSYQLTMRRLIEMAHTNGDSPYRDYDIVVEALDVLSGESSAGAITSAGAENPSGYDILNVKNPTIGYKPLTPHESLDICAGTDAIWCSDQWVTGDGDVKILWTRTEDDKDIQAVLGVLFISATDFEDIRDSIPHPQTGKNLMFDDELLKERGVYKIVFNNNSNNPKGIDVTMVNWKQAEAYICVGFGDQMDAGLYEASQDEPTFPPSMNPLSHMITNCSNVVKITQRLDIAGEFGGGLFRAYVSGKWGSWPDGESSNITTPTLYNMHKIGNMEMQLHRPLGRYRDHHGNVWGHESQWERDGRCCPDNGVNCLRLAFEAGGNSNLQTLPFTDWLSSAGERKNEVWSYEYLLVMKFIFSEELDTNNYSVVFSPTHTSRRAEKGGVNFISPQTEETLVTSMGSVSQDELEMPIQFYKNTWNHDANRCGIDTYGTDGTILGYQTMRTKIYKGKDGFIVKRQVSDGEKVQFNNQPFFIGILHM
jgi:hypothetical protein